MTRRKRYSAEFKRLIYSFVAILLLLLRNIRPKVMLWLAAGALVLSILIGGSLNFASIFFSRMSPAAEQQVESPMEANSPSAENDDALAADDNGPVSAEDQQVSIAETADDADPDSNASTTRLGSGNPMGEPAPVSGSIARRLFATARLFVTPKSVS